MKSEEVKSKNPERIRIQDFLAPPAGLEGYFVMLTSENIVVYASSTLCLRSDGYTPYFRYLPSQKDTQSFCSVAYLLSIAKEERAHGRES